MPITKRQCKQKAGSIRKNGYTKSQSYLQEALAVKTNIITAQRKFMKKLLALAFAMSATAALADASLDLTIKINDQEPVKTLIASCTEQHDAISINADLAMKFELTAQDDEGATINIITLNTTSNEVLSAQELKAVWGQPALFMIVGETANQSNDETVTTSPLAIEFSLVATQK